MKFENQVVIVTGASSGIGEGVARMFLEEGARLVGCGIEPAMKIESENAIYVQADLTDPDQAQNVVDKAVEAFGQVDKLVCCAGVTFIGSLENTEYNTFMRELSINLGGIGYCPSKAGVIMLTKCIALEYAPKVRVNCVLPGLVRTPMIEQRFQEAQDPAALEESYASLYPLHKMGKVSDMANAVKFLSSSEAGFITGEIMNVCGGSLI